MVTQHCRSKRDCVENKHNFRNTYAVYKILFFNNVIKTKKEIIVHDAVSLVSSDNIVGRMFCPQCISTPAGVAGVG